MDPASLQFRPASVSRYSVGRYSVGGRRADDNSSDLNGRPISAGTIRMHTAYYLLFSMDFN